MGSLLSRISDDINEYIDLCLRYGEEVRYSHGSEDCYGKHAEGLKKRAKLDEPARRVMES